MYLIYKRLTILLILYLWILSDQYQYYHSLAKPGLMYKSLKIITQEYRSPIWSEVFNREAKNPKDYILLNNVADLLNTTRGALNNQAKSNQ